LGAPTLQSSRSSIRYPQDEDKVFHTFKAALMACAPYPSYKEKATGSKN